MSERRRHDDRTKDATPAGFMADGPGFHVWEETHAEAARSASELAQSLSLERARALSSRRSSDPKHHASDEKSE